MDVSFYLKYLLIVVLVIIVWAFFLFAYRKKRTDLDSVDDVKGLFLIGPFYLYLRKRGFSISKREIIGGAIVLLLMIMAPIIIMVLRGMAN